MNLRSLVVKVSLAVVYLVLAVWAYGAGKGYPLYIDNTDLSKPTMLSVVIDGKSPVRVREGAYTEIMVKGARKHTISLVLPSGAEYRETFRFPAGAQAAEIRVPELAPGSEPVVRSVLPRQDR